MAVHLFLYCDLAATVWYTLCRWFDVVIVLPPDIMMSYGLLVGSGRNKRVRMGFSIVWLALVWALWRSRNDRIFNNVAQTVADVMDLIQRFSWQWFLSRTTKDSCLLYEWIWNPGECMMRG
jgi:hypothetical protein